MLRHCAGGTLLRHYSTTWQVATKDEQTPQSFVDNEKCLHEVVCGLVLTVVWEFIYKEQCIILLHLARFPSTRKQFVPSLQRMEVWTEIQILWEILYLLSNFELSVLDTAYIMGPLDQKSSSKESGNLSSRTSASHVKEIGNSFTSSQASRVLSKNSWNISRGHIPSGSETYQLVLREMTDTKQIYSESQHKGIRPTKSNIKLPGCDSPRCQVQWADKHQHPHSRSQEQENPDNNGT